LKQEEIELSKERGNLTIDLDPMLALLRPALSTSFRSIRTMSTSSTPYKIITTENAPKAIGPYSQATVHNGVAYISGCIPFVPSTMELVEGGIEAQTEQALKNLIEVVKAAGSDKSHVLKCTVFMTDMNDFAKINVSFFVSLERPQRS
jgi:2-iminobutanoate/2-iminopropanoate deaminase